MVHGRWKLRFRVFSSSAVEKRVSCECVGNHILVSLDTESHSAETVTEEDDAFQFMPPLGFPACLRLIRFQVEEESRTT